MNQSEAQAHGPQSSVIEPKPGGMGPAFRADTDGTGRWHVWRKLTARSWATVQRCQNRDEAERLANEMNGPAALA